MGKYDNYSSQNRPARGTLTHPIWRGVGFGLAILTPVIAYSAALILIDANAQNGWVAIPRDLIAQTGDPLLYVKIILTLVMVFLLYLIFSFITFILYGIFGPPRYGPKDVPPTSYRGGKYRR